MGLEIETFSELSPPRGVPAARCKEYSAFVCAVQSHRSPQFGVITNNIVNLLSQAYPTFDSRLSDPKESTEQKMNSYFVIIRGPLGSGKTSISKKLADKINAEVIPIDRIVEINKLDKDKEDGYISQASFLKSNEAILVRVNAVLQTGRPVIFDGNFYWKSQIEDLLKKTEYPSAVFTLKVPLEVCIDRDSKREKPHGKDAVEAVYKKSTEFDYGIVIDATKSVEVSIETMLKNLPPK